MKTLKYLLLGLAAAFILTGCAISADYDAVPNNNTGFDYEGW